jgi:DNA polymerase-3 subunit beta
MPVADYPALPSGPEVVGSVSAGTLAAAVGQVSVAAGRDETLPILTGVCLEFDAKQLRLVATDQYRLAVRDLSWQAGRGIDEPYPHALAASRNLLDAVRLFHPATEVAVGVGHGLIGLEAVGVRVSLRQLDGTFVKYAKVFPEQFAGHVILETEPLSEAVKAIALVAERNTPVRLRFAPGQATVAAAAGDQASATVTLDAGYGGEPLMLAVNPQYLLDGLGALETPFARLSFTTETKPAVLFSMPSPDAVIDESYRYLFLPVRITS